MSFCKRVLLLAPAVIFCGCETPPDSGAPRAPLPSEIKNLPQSSGTPQPKSIAGIRQKLEAKKAADEAARKAAQEGGAPTPTATTGGAPAAEAAKATESKPADHKDAPPASAATSKPATSPKDADSKDPAPKQ